MCIRDSVHIGLHRRLQQIARGGHSDPPRKRIRRNPVRPLGENIAAIDAELEAQTRRVLFGDQRGIPQADAPRQDLIAKPDHQIMQHLRALPRRPPQRRVFDDQRGLGPTCLLYTSRCV